MTLEKTEFLIKALETLFKTSDDLLFIKDSNLIYINCSTSFANMVNKKTSDELIGKTDFDLFDFELAKRYIEDDKALMESEVSIINNIEPIPDENGRKKYSSTSKHLIRDDNNNVIGIFGIARDVTAQIELEEEKEKSELSTTMFKDILEADLMKNQMIRAEGDMWKNLIKNYERVEFTRMVKLISNDYIHSKYVDEFNSFYDLNALIEKYNKGIKEFSHITYMCNDKKNYRWIEIKSKMYMSKVTNSLRLVSFLQDSDEEIRLKQHLTEKAQHDDLTNLFNRQSMKERISQCLVEHPNQMNALLFIDLDYFKNINDTYGHIFGDKILINAAEKLKSVFQNELIGRIGGDEFIVLIEDVDDIEQVKQKAENIVSLLKLHMENEEIEVTCSVGITLFSKNDSIDQVINQADQAMYQAKQNGKSQISLYFTDKS